MGTDAAKASRERTEKYKKKMGEDYAVILEANQTYHADLFKEHAAESAVKAAQAKLEKDSDELATAQQELKENEEKAAAAAAEAAKAKEHEAAQAALEAATAHAAVASAANTSDVMEAQAELIEETPQLWHTTTHQTDQGRRLLAHDDSSCSTDTQAAYDHCRSVVDDAYAGCTTL